MQIGSNPISPTNKNNNNMKRKRLKGAFVCSSKNYELTIRVRRPKRYFILFWGELREIKFSEIKTYKSHNAK